MAGGLKRGGVRGCAGADAPVLGLRPTQVSRQGLALPAPRPPMDRITRVRIKNVRAIASVEIELAMPVTVLIGENGSGKSTIIECLELLSHVASGHFTSRFYEVHGGAASLLRKGQTELSLGIDVEDSDGVLPKISYDLTLAVQGGGMVVHKERLRAGPTPACNHSLIVRSTLESMNQTLNDTATEIERQRQRVQSATIELEALGVPATPQSIRRVEFLQHEQLRRQAALQQLLAKAEQQRVDHRNLTEFADSKATEPLIVVTRNREGRGVFDPSSGTYQAVPQFMPEPTEPLIGKLWPSIPNDGAPPLASATIARLRTVLEGIQVHLPFDTRASWLARAHKLQQTMRGGTTVFPTTRLSQMGANLANAWNELRVRPKAQWERALGLVLLGLGERVEDVITLADRGGGTIHLAVRFAGIDEPVFAADLSDGQLVWLAFVALAALHEGRSLLAFDEPELHLHPALLGRAISLLSNLKVGAPVLISTHSDRVLELVDDPASAVRVCSLEGNEAVVSCLDPEELAKWLKAYDNFGELRAAGFVDRVLKAPTATPPGDSEER